MAGIFYNLYETVHLVTQYEFKRFFYKSIFYNTKLNYLIRFKALKYLSSLNRRTSISSMRLYCTNSLRTRSIITLFKLSRMSFRYYYSYGYMVGIRKNSR